MIHLSEDIVYCGTSSLINFTEFLAMQTYSSVHLLTDEHTKSHCLPLFPAGIFNSLLSIHSGEKNKRLFVVEDICRHLLKENADRKSVLVNLGGGMVGDIGGFAASVYKRGIDFVNIPTTLLAMIDASIGGKTGVDLDGNKNMIGTFKKPKAVFIYPEFLKTLPFRELMSGYAEIIKHGLIAEEKLMESAFKQIQDNPFQIQADLIQANVDIKQAIVSEDFREEGKRRLLNFGHTIGHAIETCSMTSVQLFHGEAIAIGLVAELYISSVLSGFDTKQLESFSQKIRAIYPDIILSGSDAELIELMKSDKKNEDDKITMFTLKGVGLPDGIHHPTAQLMLESLDFVRNVFSKK